MSPSTATCTLATPIAGKFRFQPGAEYHKYEMVPSGSSPDDCQRLSAVLTVAETECVDWLVPTKAFLTTVWDAFWRTLESPVCVVTLAPAQLLVTNGPGGHDTPSHDSPSNTIALCDAGMHGFGGRVCDRSSMTNCAAEAAGAERHRSSQSAVRERGMGGSSGPGRAVPP